MKILHVLDHSAPYLDGYSSRSKYILEFQKQLGLSPIAVTSPKHTLSSRMEEEIGGITFYRTQPPDGNFSKLKNKVPFLREKALMSYLRKNILKITQKHPVDIIHAYSPFLWGESGLKIAKKLGIPIVYEVRCLWEDAAVDSGKFTEKSIRYKLSRYQETKLMRQVDAITTICEGLKNEIASRKIEPDKIHIIPNGVDTEKFVPQSKDEDLISKYGLEDKAVVGFIGSFFKSEGLVFLVEAWQQILRKCKDVRLLMVGGGEDEGILKELVQQNSTRESVIFTGKVTHDEVIKYYSVMDILVYPRLPTRQNNLVTPLKPLEAMAMEKTVLASDVGGLKELINDRASGELFEAGNTDDLVSKCVNLIADEAYRKKLGQQARIGVIKNRNWQDIVSSYIDIYKDFIET